MHELSTILRDKLPRTLAYPVAEGLLASDLHAAANLDHVALYFLYGSSPQALVYDPARSALTHYPVLVLRRGLPSLRVETLTGDLDSYGDTCSILSFPVKARLRPRVAAAIREQGMRPLQKWLTAAADPELKQRPLVLYYDETAQRISARFAEDWTGDERDRQYR